MLYQDSSKECYRTTDALLDHIERRHSILYCTSCFPTDEQTKECSHKQVITAHSVVLRTIQQK